MIDQRYLRDIQACFSGRASVMPDGDKVYVTEVFASRTSLSDDERVRAQKHQDVMFAHRNYQRQVNLVRGYRETVPEFEQHLFRDPIRLAVTPVKPTVRRPARMSDEEEYRAIQRRLEPPFVWFNERVNRDPARGLVGGTGELLQAFLDLLLESGMVGYWIAMATESYRGVRWRVPAQVHLYNGRDLRRDKDAERVGREVWTVPQGSRGPAVPLVDDPARGIYAGVHRYDGRPGQSARASDPPIPYLPMVDTCLSLELHVRGDLATLSQNERSLGLWVFDFEAMERAEVPWNDSEDAEGNTIKGAMSLFLDQREAARAQKVTGRMEATLPSYISYREIHPDFELLKEFDKLAAHQHRIAMAAGIRYSPEGEFLETESEKWQEVGYHDLRANHLTPFLRRIYEIITDENRSWLGRENGIEGWDPFVWSDDADLRKLLNRRGVLPETQLRQRRELFEAVLDGVAVNLEVLPTLTPSPARRDSRIKELAAMQSRGVLSPQSLLEAAGQDPENERARMVEAHSDRIEIDPTTQPVHTALLSFVQQVVRDDGARETRSPQSPGRPLGAGDEDPREDEE